MGPPKESGLSPRASPTELCRTPSPNLPLHHHRLISNGLSIAFLTVGVAPLASIRAQAVFSSFCGLKMATTSCPSRNRTSEFMQLTERFQKQYSASTSSPTTPLVRFHRPFPPTHPTHHPDIQSSRTTRRVEPHSHVLDICRIAVDSQSCVSERGQERIRPSCPTHRST